jgi:hypothetical protein
MRRNDSSGMARPSCNTESHFCRLACSGDSDCPTGFTCQDGTKCLPQGLGGASQGLPQMCMQTITIQMSR